MLSERTARDVLDAALCRGADYAELFYEETETNIVEVQNGDVTKANCGMVAGAGVRVLLGTQSAYAYTAELTEDALIETARAAAAALKRSERRDAAPFAVRRGFGRTEIPFSSVTNAMRVPMLLEAARVAREVSPDITQAVSGYMDRFQRVMIATSEGVLAYDDRPRTRSYVRAVAMKDGVAQTGFEGPGCSLGFEAYRTRIDMNEVARVAANTAVTMLYAPECPAAVVPVVIDDGFGGVIFHEACGHSLEATAVSKGNSEFCGKLGMPVASACVSAVDDGTLAGEWGTLRFDDEGMPTRRNVLIENGVLKSYMIDLVGSRRMNLPTTGSSRRQGYAYMPTSRMTNTFLLPGGDDEEEMIRTMGEGLYAKKMGGGSVNPATGEFNFAVAEGYWVRDGRIVTPVRGATLVGKGTEILRRIDRVGKTCRLAEGMCGSVSGSIPTCVGQPRIRVTDITVGGKGGAI